MFDHVTIRVSDHAASRRFYAEALGEPTADGDYVEWGGFSLVPDGETTRNAHLGFGVESRDAVDAWWERMTAAGYGSDGEPGWRPEYNDSYYGGFVLDPDGNSVEAMHHAHSRIGLDHVWLRTRNVAAERDFYDTIADVVGLVIAYDSPEKVRFSDGDGSFTFVAGTPTVNLHVAFGVSDFATVQRFHEVATSAGYIDNGVPGERPEYHPGYHGAFVLDPDGHNVEAVFHRRS